MIDLIKTMVVCFTATAVILPVVFVVALSLPSNSEFRRMCLQLCYWGVALLSVFYFACPIDLVPDVFFPFGVVDDVLALGVGYMSVRRAMRPANDATLRN